MKVKAIIFGSTGMIGQAVLLECLDSPLVESILVINRKPGGVTHKKVKEIIHSDFFDFSNIENEFKQYNACFFCLGISSVGLSESEYHKITFDITINAAKAFINVNKEITFCYLSGASTDSTEKGRSMWARVKGKTENALLRMPFKKAYMFRPGYIQPLRGIKSKTKLYSMVYAVFKPLYFILKPFKSIVTDTTSLGKSMINAAAKGYEKNILEVSDINKLAQL